MRVGPQGERMRADLVRRPTSAWEVVADVVRVAGIVSVVVAAVGWGASAGSVVLLAASAALLARTLGLRGGIDAAFGASMLVAAWSGVVDVYRAIGWWDVWVHVVCTGLIVLLVLLVLARADVLTHPRDRSAPAAVPIAMGAVLGLALSAVWEIAEWLGHTLVDSAIFVAYDDTIGDMAVGGLGALLAGVVARVVRLERATAGEGRAP